MTVPPPRKKSRLVFWIAISLIGIAILTTFFLANDMRHLKSLVRRYDPTFLNPPPPPAKEIAATTAKPKPSSLPPIALPRHAFDPPAVQTAAAFLRRWAISGTDLCAHLGEAGLHVGPWAQSGFDTGTYECSYASEPTTAGLASFFIIARGTPSGDMVNLRIKLIAPDGDPGKAVREKFATTLALLERESRWNDLPFAEASALQNAARSAFGATLTFSHEFEDPHRFNFILGLERDTPERRRTGSYFDREKWLPLPPTA